MRIRIENHSLDIDESSLIQRGFAMENGKYIYEGHLLGGALLLRLVVDDELREEVYDESTGDLYTLYRLPNLHSGYAYSVKAAVEEKIASLFPELNSQDAFGSSRQFRMTERFVKEAFDEPTDCPFEGEDIRIFRLKENRKWYGIAMKIMPEKIGLEGSNPILVLQVRVEKKTSADIVNHLDVMPPYHMNKQNWIALVLDYNLDDDRIIGFLSSSRDIVLHKK